MTNLTAIIGRNESGKSNLLRAIHCLNPAEGVKKLKESEIFPRQMDLDDGLDSTIVVLSLWELNSSEKKDLAGICSSLRRANRVEIQRTYGGYRYVNFPGVSNPEFPAKKITSIFSKIAPVLKRILDELENEASESPDDETDEFHEDGESESQDDKTPESLDEAVEIFESCIKSMTDNIEWASNAKEAISNVRSMLGDTDKTLSKPQEAHLATLESTIGKFITETTQLNLARKWIRVNMPIFVFLDVYPEMTGSMNIPEHLDRLNNEDSMETDENFSKMCKVAGLNLERIRDLHEEGNQSTRKQLANQAGARLTKEIQRLWNDKKLKVRFDVDGSHINTFISAPSGVRDVDIELNERSRGFQWFFSFYVTFAADTKNGNAANAIILLDEPGLHLHAKSQRDLLKHLEKDFDNQILYTTHSPFMVPTHNLDSIRTVVLDENLGTIVANTPTSHEDSKTLFPLQAAIGYDLAQSLFIGQRNLIVEGNTDYLILSTISDYLASKGEDCLKSNITITPAGGAQKIPYMAAFLSSGKLNVVVLLDHEKGAFMTRDEIVKTKFINDKKVIFVSEGFGESPPPEADIEDLLDAKIYEELVHESYYKELKGRKLKITSKAPRIAVRVSDGLKKLGIEFRKSRPIHILVSRMGKSPDQIVTEDVEKRFKILFKRINASMEK